MPSDRPFTILCVEDEPELLEDLVLELRDCGFAAVPAGDAASALAVLRAACVDLILCDIQLPGMDGLAFFREATGASLNGNALVSVDRFVFLSAFSDSDLARQVAALGVSDLLLKPVDYEHLIDLVLAKQRSCEARG